MQRPLWLKIAKLAENFNPENLNVTLEKFIDQPFAVTRIYRKGELPRQIGIGRGSPQRPWPRGAGGAGGAQGGAADFGVRQDRQLGAFGPSRCCGSFPSISLARQRLNRG